MTTFARITAATVILAVVFLLLEPAWRIAAHRRRVRRLRVQAIAVRPQPRTVEEWARQREIDALERAWMWDVRR